MACIFVTGSSTGLGLFAGKQLLSKGHEVIWHARNAERAEHLKKEISSASSIVVGDLSSVHETLDVADQVNMLGPIDAAIHNAGVGYGGAIRLTPDGLPDIFAVNVLAPFILTARIESPRRLVYISSGMHRVAPKLADPFWRSRSWSGSQAYSESKFYVTALAFAVARLKPAIHANAVDPGWVPTRMGGQAAPDDPEEGAATQVALAIGEDNKLSRLSGQYLYHMAVREPERRTRDTQLQDQVLDLCRELSGVSLEPSAFP